MIVALGGADEGGSRFVLRVVNDGDTAFDMFASKLSDEREVASTIYVGLYLGNELGERDGSGLSGVVITI